MQRLLFLILITSISPVFAGEVELFIPSDRIEQISLDEEHAQKEAYKAKFESFKKNVTLPVVHENTLNDDSDDIISAGGAVIVDDSILTEVATISDNPVIHENSLQDDMIELAASDVNTLKIHENSLEFSNFIVHENSISSKYSQELLAVKTPDSDKTWNSAAFQATLLFSTSAKDRDTTIRKLIANGDWLSVATKLLSSDDDKVRLNGISILKAAIDTPKYSDVPVEKKLEKLSDLLITSLNDSNSKIRFISALSLSKLTANNFNYSFNSDPQSRKIAITAWDNHIKSTYGL